MMDFLRRAGRLSAVLLTLVACAESPSSGPAAEPAPTAPGNPLQGVWSAASVDPGDGTAIIDPAQPGLYIFAERHYSGVYALGSEPRTASADHFQPTDEEMVAQYQSIIVNSGTYEVSGSTVTFRPMIAKSPGFVGGEATAAFEIDGDMLTMTFERIASADGTLAPDVSGSMTFRRLE